MCFFFSQSFEWPKDFDADHIVWLYLIVVFSILSNIIVSNLGHGNEIFKRLLASGFFLTATGGSKTHDKLNRTFTFAQFVEAKRVRNRLRALYFKFSSEEILEIEVSYLAFKLGISFVHFSDDCLSSGLRKGIPFAELTNREAYFARHFDLSIKQEPREWPMTTGKEVMNLLLGVMKTDSAIFGPDCLIMKNEVHRMEGVDSKFDLRTYEQRCNNWYPLLSEYDPDVGLTRKGVSFLRFHFVQKIDLNGVVNLMPVRDKLEVFPKIYFAKQKYDDPAKRLMQLKQLSFFCPIWSKEYQVLHNMHDEYLRMKWPCIGNTKNRFHNPRLDESLKNDFNYWFGHVDDNSFLEIFPSQDYIFKFFMDKDSSLTTYEDDRTFIIESEFRSYKPKVVWDLIRSKKKPYDAIGAYPRLWLTKIRERQIKNKKTIERKVPKVFESLISKGRQDFQNKMSAIRKTGSKVVVNI